jgi:hypothetical protein
MPGYANRRRTFIGFDGNYDAFSRLRVSNPQGLFDAQFTHDLQPLLFEAVTNGTGATVTHDATNRAALMTFSSTATGGKSYLQSYENFRYQPGKSQQVFITFNMRGAVANCLKFAGYSNGVNGIEFQLNGTQPRIALYSTTSTGDQFVNQSAWNIDPMDGSGTSNVTLDFSLEQILVIDFQALYVGRVRVGWDVDGQIYYCHEFDHANSLAFPYIATANLPLRVGMTCTGTVSTTMIYNCSSVISEGGSDMVMGYSFSAKGTATAGNNVPAHILSIRPKTTFNNIANRTKFVLDGIDLFVTGNAGVTWDLCLGQAISGTTTFTDVNTTYSAFEYNTAGTISGSPAAIIASGYTAATAVNKSVSTAQITNRYPIALDAAGLARSLGTLSLIVTGDGATSACKAIFVFHEVR